MKEIKLSQGKVALVDDEDFEYLNQWKWAAYKSKNSFYAGRAEMKNGKCKTILMHRVILKITEKKIFIDHRDRNGLNNQRYNLREATHKQNQSNAAPLIGKISKYKGVTYNRDKGRKKRWVANIFPNGKTVHIGHFLTEEEAALAYNKKAIEIQGEFAYLNHVM